jgi:hypothetical protein
MKCAVTQWNASGQCQLQALSPIPRGAEVLRELPLVKVALGQYAYGTHVWDMVDRILSVRTVKREFYGWGLKQNPKQGGFGKLDVEVTKALAQKHGVSRDIVQSIYLTVGTNNIGYVGPDGTLRGFGLYKIFSRANHACDPNMRISPGDAAAGEVVLVALQDIQPGEAVTWRYLDVADEQDFSVADYRARNGALATLCGFVCACVRCSAEQPAELRDVDLLSYFLESNPSGRVRQF